MRAVQVTALRWLGTMASWGAEGACVVLGLGILIVTHFRDRELEPTYDSPTDYR